MSIFRPEHKARTSFDLYSSFSHFMPDGGQVVVLLLFMLLGTVLANIVVLLLNLVPGAGAMQTYMMLISYPIMFIPAMIYSANKIARSSGFPFT